MIEDKARTLATNLHARHCHSEDGEGCTWNYESWNNVDGETVAADSVRQKYLSKAHKLLRYFDEEEVNKVIKFLSDVNPKLAYQLVKEL